MKKTTVFFTTCMLAALAMMGCGKSAAKTSKPAQTKDDATTKTSQKTTTATTGETPFARHGLLHVDGANLVDEKGEQYQLYGMSTHGIAWFPQFVNAETFQYLRDDWNTNCIRLAMYTYEDGGYCTDGNKDELKELVDKGVNTATELGMYVIVDWHILNEETPLKYQDEAAAFFEEMSAKYKDKGNVIYEICNEPNRSGSWADVTDYANKIIPTIRKNSPNAVIIVGTPTWSQDIQEAAAKPLDYDNIMYALHFYAGTHKQDLRNRAEKYIKEGLPVFISEFGTCDASGNGAIDYEESAKWKELIDQYQISYMCWNLGNKNESSSIIKQECTALSNWSEDDLNEQGVLVSEWFKGEDLK